MKTILLLHDEAKQPLAVVPKRATCQAPSPRDRSCRRLQLRSLGPSLSGVSRPQENNKSGDSSFITSQTVR